MASKSADTRELPCAITIVLRGLGLLVLIAVLGCSETAATDGFKRSVKVDNELVTFPEQEWSEADAEWFYSVSQGSQMMPFDWVKALKTADGTKLFAATIPSYGYIERYPSKDNPWGLPVGFVKDKCRPETGWG